MNRFSASYHQERLWFIDHFEKGSLYPNSPVYHNLSSCLKVSGRIDIGLLKSSLELLAERHEALRTSVKFENETIFQEITDEPIVNCLSESRNYDLDKSEIDLWIKERTFEPIPLDRATLMRVHYLECVNESFLLLAVHHAVADRKSMDILVDDFIHLYNNLEQGKTVDLPELALQYVDFSDWQKSLPEETINDFMLHWKGNLQNLTPLQFHTDQPREEVHIYEAEVLSHVIEFGRVHGDPFFTFLSAFKILLNKYSGQKEIVCGVQHENREMEELDGVVGAISNLLVLNNKLEDDHSIADIQSRIASNYTAAVENVVMPFDYLVQKINPAKDMSRTALFDVLFQYEDRSEHPEYLLAGHRISRISLNLGLGKYDYNLLVTKTKEGFELQFTYNSLYYKKQSAERFIRHFDQVLSEMSNQSMTLKGLNILSEEEQKRIVQILNIEDTSWPRNEDIITAFLEQVQNHPDKVSLQIDSSNRLTYKELDNLSNQLSSFLKDRYEVAEGDLVAILLPRGIYQVVSILAILKCNAAYVPIDIEYPVDRVNYTLEDAQVKVCLDEEKLGDFLTSQSDFLEISVEYVPNPNARAYVIYTSGSTGKPKGVQVSHQNVIRLFKTNTSIFQFTENDVWTMFHSYCFDFSVWEMYGALLFGGKVIIVSKDIAIDPKALLTLLHDEKVTIFNSTPSVFYNLLKVNLWEQFPSLSLKSVVFGGEKLNTSRLSDWMRHYPTTDLINMYGITETTVHVTCKKIDEAIVESGISNIGIPIPSSSCLILDENQNVVPELIPGELWIGGAGVTLGYLNNQELTQERFQTLPNREGVYYRSGDKARLLSSGDIEYLGRIDDQVKIRGFRIELGEVIDVLSKFKSSVQVTAIARELNDNMTLIAYFTAAEEVDIKSLRNFASSKLPSYMIPQHFVRLEAFPVTINGKIDVDKLPNPNASKADGNNQGKPTTVAEVAIAQSWAKILAIDISNIDLESDFFELGGDSLKASVFINDVLDKLGVKLSLDQIFRSANLSQLSEMVANSEREKRNGIAAMDSGQDIPITSAQTGMWFMSQMGGMAAASYNMIQPILVKGRFDGKLFEEALNHVCRRHESLRTNVVMSPLGLIQTVRDMQSSPYLLVVQSLEVSWDKGYKAFEDTLVMEKKRPFDLANEALLRITQISYSDECTALIFNINHIISDGWSMSLFFQELIDNYHQLSQGTYVELPPDKVQFKEYATWMQGELEENKAKLDAFWKEYLADLPKPFLTSQSASYEGKSKSADISKITVEDVASFCKEHSVTQFMFFWTVCADVLSKAFGSADIVMVSPNAIRPRKEFEKVMGLCLNTMPVRVKLGESASMVSSMEIVRTSIEEVRKHDYLPLNAIVELVRNQTNYTNDIFGVLFAFQNQENLAELEEVIELKDVSFEFLPNESETAKYGLCFSIRVQEKIHVDIEYNVALLSEQKVIEILNSLEQGLEIVKKQ